MKHPPIAAGVPPPLSKRLSLRRLRDLDVHSAASADRPPFLCAASGLVRTPSALYVIADDEGDLGRFPLQGTAPGERMPLLPAKRPVTLAERKRYKHDLEVLLQLPSLPGMPEGALLALGSGSGPLRSHGALLPLDAQGRIAAAPRQVDASVLYASLATEFPELNLEGAWLRGETLHLLQRGHRGGSCNAVIELDSAPFLAALADGGRLPSLGLRAVHWLDLGQCDGVPLCFTDASVLPDGRWLFSAVAEDTLDASADGPCVAVAIGMADGRHRLQWLEEVDCRCKVEGVAVWQEADDLQLLLVTDDDDPRRPSGLFAASRRKV